VSAQEPPPARSPAKSPLCFIGETGRGSRVETGSTLAAAHLLTQQRFRSFFLKTEIGLNPSICLRASSSSTSIARHVTVPLHTPVSVRGERMRLFFIFYCQSRHRLHFEAQMSNAVASPLRRSELGATTLLTRPPRPREKTR
jgi:hypothetical protein